MGGLATLDRDPSEWSAAEDHPDAPTSTSRSVRAVTDHPNVLIIRAALFGGATRVTDFQRTFEITPEVLSSRLNALVDAGVMTLHPDDGQPEEAEYRLTTMGRDLESVIVALTIWDLRWTASQDQPALFVLEDREGAAQGEMDSGDRDPLVIEIQLLGTFALRVGSAVLDDLPFGSQRLLAFLALQDRTVARIAMAGAMWPEATDRGAGISLRSALSRLDAPTRGAILTASSGLRLADAVVVDFREAQALAHRLLEPGRTPDDVDLSVAATVALSSELLPDWYDDWVVGAAEDWRQLRVSALESQANLLMAAGRLADAAGSARAAIRVDALRESAHAILIELHLAEGNQSEALRVFDRYQILLHNELGISPTRHLSDLIASIRKK